MIWNWLNILNLYIGYSRKSIDVGIKWLMNKISDNPFFHILPCTAGTTIFVVQRGQIEIQSWTQMWRKGACLSSSSTRDWSRSGRQDCRCKLLWCPNRSMVVHKVVIDDLLHENGSHSLTTFPIYDRWSKRLCSLTLSRFSLRDFVVYIDVFDYLQLAFS